MIEGIDVSAYQGQVSWEDVKSSGHRFAAMKATEGLGYEDPTFPRNWERSKARGLVRVAYHFLRPGESGAAQADYLHRYVRNHGRFESGDGIMLDLETMDGQSRETVINCAVGFVSRILDQTIAGVFVYTYPDFWLNQLGNPRVPILAKCPLWLADYGPSVPHIPNWPNGLSIWQFSQTGWVPGVQGQVDLDRYYGNIATLHQLCRFGGRS